MNCARAVWRRRYLIRLLLPGAIATRRRFYLVCGCRRRQYLVGARQRFPCRIGNQWGASGSAGPNGKTRKILPDFLRRRHTSGK